MTSIVDRSEELREMYEEDNPDGDPLLGAAHDALTKYVIFPSSAAAVAVTLWVAATHGLPAWQHATRLVIRSPQKRCGKSRLLDIVRLMSFKPMASSDMSAAVIYRSIGGDDTATPTLFVDEADALFGTKVKADQNEDLRGLFNAGFQRDRTVWRCVGPTQTPTEFHTFAMAALAAIKGLPDTIEDRAAIIDLKRRSPSETVARFRLRRDTAPLLKIREQLTGWVRESDRMKRLTDYEPAMPSGVEDRQQDAWEPLIAIADEAGGDWPERARAACRDLCASVMDDSDNEMQLLADINEIFTEAGAPYMRSVQLVTALKACDESPWLDEQLTTHRLAKMLKPFAVGPRKLPGNDARGYHQADFMDCFRRYIRPEASNRPAQSSQQRRQGETK